MSEDDDYPYDDYDDDREDDTCDHDERDVDILTGRAHCWRCGEAWWLTSDELRRELELHALACEVANEWEAAT